MDTFFSKEQARDWFIYERAHRNAARAYEHGRARAAAEWAAMSPEEEAEQVRLISRFHWNRHQNRTQRSHQERAPNGLTNSQQHPSANIDVPTTSSSRNGATSPSASDVVMADDRAVVSASRQESHHGRQQDSAFPAYDNNTLLAAQILAEMRGGSEASSLQPRSRSVDDQTRR
jgi:hypothetical protein